MTASEQKAKAAEIAAELPLVDPPVYTHPNLAAALVAALAGISVVETGRTADLGTYTYKYADLADVVKRTRPALAANGVIALTPVHEHDGGLACTVTLLHESGERLDLGPFPFPRGANAQATGSMVTYHRRYALVAALGMAAGDDDDGAAAVAAVAPPVPGFRQSLMAAVEGLNDAERGLLREWLAEVGLPDRPSKMNAEQSERVVEWLLHGLPKVEDA